MLDEQSKYAREFKDYLERIYRQDGPEGLASSLPFISRPFVVTLEGKIVAVNDSLMDLLGYDRDELYGYSALNITCREDHDLVSRNINEDLREPYLLRLVGKDSKIKYVHVSPHIFETGGIKLRLAEFIDQTELFLLKEKHVNTLKNTALVLANTIERRDPYTHGHMRRTAEISAQIARLLTLSSESTDAVFLGASIHDIGKIAVPIEILIKPGKLEHYEWDTIKQHPVTGGNILAEVEFVGIVKDIVYSHHEYQDGSGYPDGLTGKDIPVEVAIVTVADSLEAIAGVRPYRKANTFEDSIEIMKQEASKFLPEVLEAAESLVKAGQLNGLEYGLYT